MKRQDKIKRAALKKKAEDLARFSSVGLRPDDKLMSLGIVLETVGGGAMAGTALRSIYEFSKRATGIDVAVFVQHMSRPCAQVLCPLLDPQAMLGWEDPLIATSPATCLEALETRVPVVVHYVHDESFLDPRGLSPEEFRRTFCDPRVRVVVRDETYRRAIENTFGVPVDPTAVPGFELELILPVLLPAMRGEHV